MSTKVKQKYIIVAPYKTFNWLVAPIINKFRFKYNINIIFIVPEGYEIPEIYQRVICKEDKVLFYKSFHKPLKKQIKDQKIIFKKANFYEQKYKFHSYQDIFQQERILAGSLMQGANRSLYKLSKKFNQLDFAYNLNYQINFFENIFSKNKIFLSLLWPRTSLEAVGGYVSKYHNIKVTFPYVTKGEGNLIYWANSIYANGNYHIKLYNNNKNKYYKKMERVEPTDRASLKRKDAKFYYSLPGLIIEILRALKIYVARRLLDLISFKWNKNLNFFYKLKELIRIYLYYKKFIKLCIKDKPKKPYALFAFQNEPEFAVQGRCKEFNDQSHLIRQIAMALPLDYTLYIKEHTWIGSKDITIYKNILKLPNVKMIPFFNEAKEYIKNAEFVASLNGSVLFEAALEGVKGISFSHRSEFRCLKNVTFIENIKDLPLVIRNLIKKRKSLKKNFYIKSANKFLDVSRKISYDGTPMFKTTSKKISDSELNKAFHILDRLLIKRQL